MKKTRLIITGGFLGAGKTTLIREVAKQLIKEGKKVGLITNDQASELVDSEILRASNLKVSEVAGSCFCCNFNGFTDAIRNIRQEAAADIILAEPVGSCADLSATIMQPLKQYWRSDLYMSPLTVLTDPARLKDILFGGNGGLHEDAAYIYRKQLEESDIILISKCDTLKEEEIKRLVKQTRQAFPSSKVMTVSAVTSDGIQSWLETVGTHVEIGNKLLDIDYDKYAHGEAVLGWLNGTAMVHGVNSSWDELLKVLMQEIAKEVDERGLRVGHIKIIAENEKTYAVGNITGTGSTMTLRGEAGKSNLCKLIINARVEMSPEELDKLIKDILDRVTQEKYVMEITAWRYLQPGRPNPTHRFTQVIN